MRMDDSLARLIREQHGLLSRRRAAEHGLSRDAVRWALGRRWRLVLPRVMLTTGGGLDHRQRLIAGLLHAGPGTVIASLSAAEWHGVSCAASASVHVLAPANRHPRSHGFVVV